MEITQLGLPELAAFAAVVDLSVAVVFKPLVIKIRHDDELRRGITSTLLNMANYWRNCTKPKDLLQYFSSLLLSCDITHATEAWVPSLQGYPEKYTGIPWV